MHAALLAGLMILAAGEAVGQEDTGSASFMVAGCRAVDLTGKSMVDPTGKLMMCLGAVSGVWDTAAGAGWVCSPTGTTRGQAVRTVVQYIDAHPTRIHDRFTSVALEALRAAWPCR
jgi:hypothetical protein